MQSKTWSEREREVNREKQDENHIQTSNHEWMLMMMFRERHLDSRSSRCPLIHSLTPSLLLMESDLFRVLMINQYLCNKKHTHTRHSHDWQTDCQPHKFQMDINSLHYLFSKLWCWQEYPSVSLCVSSSSKSKCNSCSEMLWTRNRNKESIRM